jgi:hypothetical protein
MRAGLIVMMLSVAGGAAWAQSGEESVTGLDSCFQAARLANGICANLTHDPARRFDCFQIVRDAHLACLEHIPSPDSVGAAPPAASSATVHAGSLPDTGAPEVPSGTVLPGEPGPARTGSIETPSGNTSARQSSGPPQAIPVIPETIPSGMPITSLPTRQAEPARPDIPARTTNIPAKPPAPDWLVSETTSPVDYSPLVTAVIRATTNAKDGPNTLTVRCRGRRTELLVSTAGVWVAPHGGQLQVDYQIDDQPFVRSLWTSSADGKSVSYSDDPVGLLQSLAEGARLTIDVSDRVSPRHEATFQLAGWDAIRKKVGATCKWTPATANISPGKQNSVTAGRNSSPSLAIPSIERRPRAQ